MRHSLLFLGFLVVFSVIGMQSATANDINRSFGNTGPLMSVDELIQMVIAAYPGEGVTHVTLEEHDQQGLVYEVRLTDSRRVYVNANSGLLLRGTSNNQHTPVLPNSNSIVGLNK
jgi:uncharacterized membrane protein YkoI